MRCKAPAPSEANERENKKQRLKDFIQRHIAGPEGSDSVLVLARSIESPVACALLELAPELSSRGMEAQLIVADSEQAQPSVTAGSSQVAAGYEIRIARNRQLMNAHEQLVVGSQAAWFGDSLRRDPLKRDAFERFISDDAEAGRLARMTFDRLWCATAPNGRSRSSLASRPS